MISVQIVADSLNLKGGRLTSIVATYPRFIHPQVLTHRQFSRNSSSSRAVSVGRTRKMVLNDIAMPEVIGVDKKGMGAEEYLEGASLEEARSLISLGRDLIIDNVYDPLVALGVHKQTANRYLEPWMHITTIITASEWNNFFAQRCSDSSQPEIQRLANLIYSTMEESEPVPLGYGEWHLPFVDEVSLDLDTRKKISVARCARVSYLSHDGKRNIDSDLDLYEYLEGSGHWSPFEHQATPGGDGELSGNFSEGWTQHRKLFRGEYRDSFGGTL